MELGLFCEAAERFSWALNVNDTQDLGVRTSSPAVRLSATLGLGVALLSIAQIEAQDGKAGAALECLQQAIRQCNTTASRW